MLALVNLVEGQNYQIPWSVLNEGGNTEEATSTSYRLRDAIGQPVIGTCESADYKAYIGFWTPKPLGVVGVEEKFVESEALPLVYSLSQNYPNPFTDRTSIRYSLAMSAVGGRPSAVNLRIFDLSGRLVKTFDLTNNESPINQLIWTGRDEQGQKVAPGIYFYKLETNDYKNTKKLILLK